MAIGAILVAQSMSSTPSTTNAQSAASSTVESGSNRTGASRNSAATTTTVIGGPTTSTVPENAPQGSVTTNSTPAGVPNTDPQNSTGGTPPTQGSPQPTTTPTSPTVAPRDVTTTAPRRSGDANPPIVTIDATATTNDPKLILKFSVSDKNSYISRVEINWNDLSGWTVIENPMASCTNVIPLPNDATHTYAVANSYKVAGSINVVNCTTGTTHAIPFSKDVAVGGSGETTTTTTVSGL